MPPTVKQVLAQIFCSFKTRRNTSKMRKITSKQRRTTSNSFTTSKTKRRPLQAFADPSPIQALPKTKQRKIEEKASNKNFDFSKKECRVVNVVKDEFFLSLHLQRAMPNWKFLSLRFLVTTCHNEAKVKRGWRALS